MQRTDKSDDLMKVLWRDAGCCSGDVQYLKGWWFFVDTEPPRSEAIGVLDSVRRSV